jgi:hypothetical protein
MSLTARARSQRRFASKFGGSDVCIATYAIALLRMGVSMSYRSSKRTLSFLAVLLFACVLGAVPARANVSTPSPAVTTFAATSPSETLDIQITSFAIANATYYLITTSSTAPRPAIPAGS